MNKTLHYLAALFVVAAGSLAPLPPPGIAYALHGGTCRGKIGSWRAGHWTGRSFKTRRWHSRYHNQRSTH